MAQIVDAGSVPAVDPDVSWIEVEGEVVAVHGRTRVVHLVSETGALLWPFLDGQTPISALAADVSQAFGISFDRAMMDIVGFVEAMVVAELVTVEAADSRGPR